MMYKGKTRLNRPRDIVELLRRRGGIGAPCVLNPLCDDNRPPGGSVKYRMVRSRSHFHPDKWRRSHLWSGVGIHFVLAVQWQRRCTSHVHPTSPTFNACLLTSTHKSCQVPHGYLTSSSLNKTGKHREMRCGRLRPNNMLNTNVTPTAANLCLLLLVGRCTLYSSGNKDRAWLGWFGTKVER